MDAVLMVKEIILISRGVCVGGVTTCTYNVYDIVRMCGTNSPLFQPCQVYDTPPSSKKKYIPDTVFHH